MEVQYISVDACKRMWENDHTCTVLLDVRSISEAAREKIPDSILIPLGELAQRAGELPRDKIICIYCASGNRSQVACMLLGAQGFDACMNVDGGIGAWKRAGFITE